MIFSIILNEIRKKPVWALPIISAFQMFLAYIMKTVMYINLFYEEQIEPVVNSIELFFS